MISSFLRQWLPKRRRAQRSDRILTTERALQLQLEGNAQTLDHLMASDNLFNSVPFVYDVVHINSEFAVQSSDHDPSVARFDFSPTASRLESFEAEAYGDQILLRWQTGEEVDNLGFNIHREESGKRLRLNPQILAGSALVAGARTEKAGRSYSCGWSRFWATDSSYWLEEIDLTAIAFCDGPAMVKYSTGGKRSAIKERQAVMLSMLGRIKLIWRHPTRRAVGRK